MKCPFCHSFDFAQDKSERSEESNKLNILQMRMHSCEFEILPHRGQNDIFLVASGTSPDARIVPGIGTDTTLKLEKFFIYFYFLKFLLLRNSAFQPFFIKMNFGGYSKWRLR